MHERLAVRCTQRWRGFGSLCVVIGLVGCGTPSSDFPMVDGHPASGAAQASGDLRRLGWTRKGADACTCHVEGIYGSGAATRYQAVVSCPKGPDSLITKDHHLTLDMTFGPLPTGNWVSTQQQLDLGTQVRGAVHFDWQITWVDGAYAEQGSGQALVGLLAPLPTPDTPAVLTAALRIEAASGYRTTDTLDPEQAPTLTGEILDGWIYCTVTP